MSKRNQRVWNKYGRKSHGEQGLRERARRLDQINKGQLSGGASNRGFVTTEARMTGAGIRVPPPLFDPRHGRAR